MNINDLTIGQIKELMQFVNQPQASSDGLSAMVGKKCIVRTYSAGVWFGEVTEKAGNEVILKNARRLRRWHTKKSISLSAIAMGDIDLSKCKIAEPVETWLEAIELIPCNEDAVKKLEGAEIVKARC